MGRTGQVVSICLIEKRIYTGTQGNPAPGLVASNRKNA